MVLPDSSGETTMSAAPMGSPKGNIRLHPADEGLNEADYEKTRPRLEEELEKMSSKQRVRNIAMRLATHVIKTPAEFIDSGKPAEQQEWAVMPDETSSEPGYKPLSKHRNRAEAVREMKNIENKAAREEESERRRTPSKKEEPKPTEELPAGQAEEEAQMQQEAETEQPVKQPIDEMGDLQNEPQSGTPEKLKKEDRQQPLVKAASRKASVERKWMDVEAAANHAWDRRQKK
jgi:hypothetical protein